MFCDSWFAKSGIRISIDWYIAFHVCLWSSRHRNKLAQPLADFPATFHKLFWLPHYLFLHILPKLAARGFAIFLPIKTVISNARVRWLKMVKKYTFTWCFSLFDFWFRVLFLTTPFRKTVWRWRNFSVMPFLFRFFRCSLLHSLHLSIFGFGPGDDISEFL